MRRKHSRGGNKATLSQEFSKPLPSAGVSFCQSRLTEPLRPAARFGWLALQFPSLAILAHVNGCSDQRQMNSCSGMGQTACWCLKKQKGNEETLKRFVDQSQPDASALMKVLFSAWSAGVVIPECSDRRATPADPERPSQKKRFVGIAKPKALVINKNLLNIMNENVSSMIAPLCEYCDDFSCEPHSL